MTETPTTTTAPTPLHTPRGTALVLGAAGGSGAAILLGLARDGWQVRGFTRRDAPPTIPGAEAFADRITWVRGDAMHADDVLAAAEGVDVIVHAVNPPGYRRWEELVVPMVDHAIAAAEAVGARLVVPANVADVGSMIATAMQVIKSSGEQEGGVPPLPRG